MATIRQIANHTGLPIDRVSEILDSLGLDPEPLSIDSARLEIIKSLRTGASGNIKKEEVETETARLCQARRIKIETQTKKLREAIKPNKSAFKGYLIDDSSSSAFRATMARHNNNANRLKKLLEPVDDKPEPIQSVIII